MENLAEFLRMFLSYGLVFIICIAVIVIAVFIGIKLRKNKDAKEELLNAEGSQTEN